ncbi:MAG: hypothetical protein Q8Q85_01615 [Gemmatimonadales bacterium]|nr:hypothetical protein [Gemmatimonadales bacterium]
MYLGYSRQSQNALRAMGRQYARDRVSPGYDPRRAATWAPPGSAVMRQAQITAAAYGFMPAGGRASGDETEGSGGSRGLLGGARLGDFHTEANPYANVKCCTPVGAGSTHLVETECPGGCPTSKFPWWWVIGAFGVGVVGTTIMGRSKR